MQGSDFKQLKVWQRSFFMVKKVYELLKQFPCEELYGLSSQIRRAAISVPSNIAEGQGRNSHKEFIRFLSIANGSLCEIETQLLLSVELGFCKYEDVKSITADCIEIGMMIKKLIAYLEVQNKNSKTQ